MDYLDFENGFAHEKISREVQKRIFYFVKFFIGLAIIPHNGLDVCAGFLGIFIKP